MNQPSSQPLKDKLWNANYYKVMATNFSMSFAFYILTPLLPIYLSETFGAGKDTIGWVLSGYTIAALVIRPLSGYVVDTFERKKVLTLFLLVYFLFFGGYLVASTLLSFFIVRTLHGGPFGASTVANSTMAIDVLPSSRRNEGIGFYGLSNNIATAIAPTIGVMIYHNTHDFSILFWTALVVSGFGLLTASTIKSPSRPPKPCSRKLSLDRFFLLRGWTLGFNLMFFGICYGVLSNYLAIYGKEKMNITDGTGYYFMLLSIGLILSRLQGSKSLRQGKMLPNAAEGILISTVGYTIFTFVPTLPGYYASALLIGLGNGHFWPAFQNMMIGMAHNNERGTANSTLLSSWDLGIGIGVLLGGVLAEHGGYESAFVSMVITHFLGLLAFFLLTRKAYLTKRLDKPSAPNGQ